MKIKLQPANILIFGPSGSGKGTQAQLLSEKLGVPTLSMGELLRQAVAQKTPEGLEVRSFMDQGKWAPLELTLRVLFPALDKHKEGFILDGYPRQFDQIAPLEEFLKTKHQEVDKAIYLWVSDEEAAKRLVLRGQKDLAARGKARSDEKPEVIQARLDSFHKTIDPILAYYEKYGKLLKIDGERPIEPIHQDIMAQVAK